MSEIKQRKILIADPTPGVISLLKNAKEAKEYLIETASTGFEAAEKIEHFQPDLILLELLLPQKHGIEILKTLRSQAHTQHVGVIITSLHPLMQNYHAALKEGANYFLSKPFSSETFFRLVKRFFEGTLSPDPFTGLSSKMEEGEHCYLPKIHTPPSYLKFWGTRGSIPVSGAEHVRFGGNTVCLEVRHGEDLLIIDAGTGIRPFGHFLEGNLPQRIHLLIGHTHWDHIIGFPFFSPIYTRKCDIHLWSPIGFEKSTKELFFDMLAYAYFPIRLDDIEARIFFNDLREENPFSIGNIHINTHYAFHPGSTLCFKLKIAGKTVGYATDNEVLLGYHGHPYHIDKHHPLLNPYQKLIDFYQNCDILIHEAQYFPLEYQSRVGWGHSSLSNAAVVVKHCNVKEWIVTHHDPKHTDEELLTKFQMLKDIAEELGIEAPLRMAFDGMIVAL